MPIITARCSPGDYFSELSSRSGCGLMKHGVCGPAGSEARQRESRALKQSISLCKSKSNKNGQNP